jgi:rhamnosyltransferase
MKQERQISPSTAFTTEAAAEAVCAVVVAYFPDEDFAERLTSLLSQVGALVVVDNTPAPGYAQQLMGLRKSGGQIRLIENHRNAGIAAALNQGLEHALQTGCKWLLTLDQDTRCYSDMVATLLHVHETCDPKAAVIGGNYFDAQNHQLKVPADGETECLEQKTVITSGSLVDVSVAQAVGGFREDYFIDQVDHEFCLRVRAHGYRVVISCKPVMEHSVGGPGGAWMPLLGILPNHPPLRKYYIARNTVVTVADYWRREPYWCLRRTVRLLLGLLLMSTLEKQRLAKIRAFAAGFMDGVRRRMGPCWREWLYRSR